MTVLDYAKAAELSGERLALAKKAARALRLLARCFEGGFFKSWFRGSGTGARRSRNRKPIYETRTDPQIERAMPARQTEAESQLGGGESPTFANPCSDAAMGVFRIPKDRIASGG